MTDTTTPGRRDDGALAAKLTQSLANKLLDLNCNMQDVGDAMVLAAVGVAMSARSPTEVAFALARMAEDIAEHAERIEAEIVKVQGGQNRAH